MSGPAPAVAQVRSAVRDDLSDLAAAAPGALVLVACSGGADSLALASALAFVAPRVGLRAGAVVVDHRLQPGSAEVAATAAATCRELGLEPVRVVPVEVGRRGGPEAAARAARHAALEAAAERDGAAAVLLGHTRDDQAETVLLGLARGSGPRSLAGMAGRRGLLHRPLLGLTRQTTAQACQELGLAAWRDPANTDPALLRSVVRASTLPTLERDLGPGVAAALARTAALAREDCEALDALAEELLARAVSGPTGGGPTGSGPTGGSGCAPGELRLDAQVLAAAPAAVRRRALLAAARRAGAPAGSLSRVHALALDARVTRWSGQGPVRLPGRVEVVRRCGTLVLRSAQHPEE